MDAVVEFKNVDLSYGSIESISYKKIMDLFKKKESIHSRYKALNDVTFTIEKGKVYGLIGNNGAGKSTLLRAIAGIIAPDSGEVEINTDKISLLSIGIGFIKELTGYDNIILNSLLQGFTKKQIDEKINEIIEFSELGDFIYKPMKNYSSGMVSRLGFAISINLKPELLLIDEVLSVGDGRFKNKSYKAIMELIKDKDITVVIVSHSLGSIKEICDEVIWLEKGKIVKKGRSEIIVKEYEEYINR